MRPIAISLALLFVAPHIARAQSSSVEVWMRAFIPDPTHAGQGSGYIVAMPNGRAGSLVRLHNVNPALPNMCFATDHRGFSSTQGSSARLETRFTLRLSPTGGATVTPAQNRTTAGVTTKADCATGATIEQKGGSVDRDHLGTPMVAQGIVQVIGQAEGRNLLTPLGGAGPAIDYNFDLQWQPSTSSLTASVNFGSFPAFEMYARQPGGPWVPVVQQLPTGAPWTLGGDSFGINTERRVAKVTVTGMAGKWQSSIPEQRFSVEIVGTKARWSERNAAGAVLMRDVPLLELPDGSFRIERANDAQVLVFLGFQPSLRAEILARGPKPSFMILSWDGANIRGDWNGLLVVKGDDAHLKEIVQPGTRPAKPFAFTRVP